MTYRFLAIDPSLRNTGWAVMSPVAVVEVGLIQTKKGPPPVYADNLHSLEIITAGLRDAAYNWAPSMVYAEAKGGSKSAKAASAMSMAQGVMVGALCSLADIHLMLPQKVKKIACGDRSASKDEVKLAMMERYPEAEGLMVAQGITQKARQEHIWDALAIGWAIHTERNG